MSLEEFDADVDYKPDCSFMTNLTSTFVGQN